MMAAKYSLHFTLAPQKRRRRLKLSLRPNLAPAIAPPKLAPLCNFQVLLYETASVMFFEKLAYRVIILN